MQGHVFRILPTKKETPLAEDLNIGHLANTVSLGQKGPAFSFSSRLAAKNRTETADFALDMGLSFTNVIADDTDTLKALAQLADISVKDLQAWTPIDALRPWNQNA